jgi:hypothetical protein
VKSRKLSNGKEWSILYTLEADVSWNSRDTTPIRPTTNQVLFLDNICNKLAFWDFLLFIVII